MEMATLPNSCARIRDVFFQQLARRSVPFERLVRRGEHQLVLDAHALELGGDLRRGHAAQRQLEGKLVRDSRV